MARKSTKQQPSGMDVVAARLDLIRKRHQALILQTRAMIAAEMASDFDDPFEAMVEADELQLVEAHETDRL